MSNLEEFSFVKNEEWLKPFLTKLKEHNKDKLLPVTFQDAIDLRYITQTQCLEAVLVYYHQLVIQCGRRVWQKNIKIKI